MNTVVFIQARVGSTRLPGKVLLPLMDKSVLEHTIERAQQTEDVDEVIVLTTFTETDLPIVELCGRKKVRVFCGSEEDVLDRFYRAAVLLDIHHIVRITADCPVIDPAVIRKVIREHLSAGADYTTNTLTETYPDGQDVEVMTRESLIEAWEHANLASEREHVTPYIRNHPQRFVLHSVENKRDLSAKRWTLDTQEDYRFLQSVFQGLYPDNPFFGMSEIVDFLEKNEELEKINSAFERNEGYMKSLREDKEVK
jgi:spore coat polysaccharide biosynthesis protein SpsF (cytidylyltransferase family)